MQRACSASGVHGVIWWACGWIMSSAATKELKLSPKCQPRLIFWLWSCPQQLLDKYILGCGWGSKVGPIKFPIALELMSSWINSVSVLSQHSGQRQSCWRRSSYCAGRCIWFTVLAGTYVHTGTLFIICGCCKRLRQRSPSSQLPIYTTERG